MTPSRLPGLGRLADVGPALVLVVAVLPQSVLMAAAAAVDSAVVVGTCATGSVS